MMYNRDQNKGKVFITISEGRHYFMGDTFPYKSQFMDLFENREDRSWSAEIKAWYFNENCKDLVQNLVDKINNNATDTDNNTLLKNAGFTVPEKSANYVRKSIQYNVPKLKDFHHFTANENIVLSNQGVDYRVVTMILEVPFIGQRLTVSQTCDNETTSMDYKITEIVNPMFFYANEIDEGDITDTKEFFVVIGCSWKHQDFFRF